MSKKLIIFDCDGVLVDSEFVSSQIFSEALAAYGVSISIEESIRRFTGINEHLARQMILEESSIDLPVNYWALQKPKLLEVYEKELSPLMQPVLQEFKNKNIDCCVASNSSKSYVTHCLALTKQLVYFGSSSIFTSEQVANPKPAPDLFLLAAKTMGYEPQDCIVIEDSPAGIEAAIAAKMQVLGFLGGSHARYGFYRQRIQSYGVPMVENAQELLQAIEPCEREL